MRLQYPCALALLLISAIGVSGQDAKNASPAASAKTEPPTIVKDPPADPTPATAVPSDPTTYGDTGGVDLGSAMAGNCVARVFWVRADYLVWWIRKETPPALVQTIPDSLAAVNTLPSGAGVTTFPTNSELNFRGFSGVRLNAGLWLNDAHTCGIDVGGFVTQTNSNNAFYSSNGSPILARSYLNANTGALTYLEFSNPQQGLAGYAGNLNVSSSISSIYSGEASFRWNGYSISADNTDWFAGFRYFNFQEKLDISGNVFLRTGENIAIADHIQTRNNFYGGQVAFNSRWCGWYGFSADAIVKLAMGDMNQSLDISGSNTIQLPNGTSTTQNTGLYAQQSNIGTFHKDKFSVIPEVTLNLNYNITRRAAIFLGYNFMYVSNVLRAANTIDPTVNDSQLRYLGNPTPGNAPGPQPIFREQGVYLQGINLGAKLDF